MNDAFRNFVQGNFKSGLRTLAGNEQWKDEDPRLDGPFFLGFPGAQGWGEGVLTASLLKRHAARFNRTIPIFCEPQVCSILNSDPAFRAEPVGDCEQVRSMGARPPLAILTHALTGDLLDFPFVPIGDSDALPQQGRGRPLIGIAWASVSRDTAIPGKSIPLEPFLSLFEGLDVEVVSFQRKLGDQECERLRDRFSGRCSTFSDPSLHAPDQTAVIQEVRKLDCMVTISTTTAHIAASVGVPVVLLTAARAYQQWFWRAQQEHGKRFYPSVQIVLGSPDEQTWWSEVLEPAKQALLAEIG